MPESTMEMNPHTDRKGGTLWRNPELASFADQFAIILKAGIPALEGLSILAEDAPEGADKKLLAGMHEEMTFSGSLASAMEKAGVFPPYMISMTRIGEETGKTDEIMEQLDVHYRREESIRKSITNALIYPMIMAGMMIAVICVLLIRVLPVFRQVFAELGTEMTGLPYVLMQIGTALRSYAIVFVILLVIVLAAILLGIFTEKGREIRYKLGSRFSSVRESREEVAACRFASAMALTLKSGLHPEQCMDLAKELNEDPAFGEKLEKLDTDLKEGEDFAESLQKEGIFTGLFARMASLGSKAGALDSVMEEIAGLYRDAIDTRLNNRLAILEPLLVIALSLIVGAILLSVMFPLLGIMSSL